MTTTSSRYALDGIVFAELAVVVAGASLITGEFATGMLRTTFTATQSRLRVLLAKALVLSLVTFPLALVTSTAAFLRRAAAAPRRRLPSPRPTRPCR